LVLMPRKKPTIKKLDDKHQYPHQSTGANLVSAPMIVAPTPPAVAALADEEAKTPAMMAGTSVWAGRNMAGEPSSFSTRRSRFLGQHDGAQATPRHGLNVALMALDLFAMPPGIAALHSGHGRFILLCAADQLGSHHLTARQQQRETVTAVFLNPSCSWKLPWKTDDRSRCRARDKTVSQVR
jgi:hypothetical protein